LISDPTPVRAVTGNTFEMMNRAKNLDWAKRNVNITLLALMLDINFVTMEAIQTYDAPWRKRIDDGTLTMEEVREASKTQLGVIREFKFSLRADKSHLGQGKPIKAPTAKNTAP
jgi:hypothetical protein